MAVTPCLSGHPPMVVGQAYDLYSPYQYPWMTLNIFLAVWMCSIMTASALRSLSRSPVRAEYLALEEFKKRNVVTYVILFVGTTFALVAQLYGGFDILFLGDDTPDPDDLNWATFALELIIILYVWEMIYRLQIGYPLLAHHLCTILLIQLVTASFFDTYNVVFLRFGLLLGFHATTEQLCFLALLNYRLNIFPRHRGWLFLLSAVQAFLVKTIVTVVSVAYYAYNIYKGMGSSGWDMFWMICAVPLFLMLYAAQIYACRIMIVLGRRCQKELTPPNEVGSQHGHYNVEEGVTETPTSTPDIDQHKNDKHDSDHSGGTGTSRSTSLSLKEVGVDEDEESLLA